MWSLRDKKTIIIGGSYGMGLSTAERAIEAGATVAIAARGERALREAAENLESLGGRPVAWRVLRIENREAVGDFLRSGAPFDHLVLPGSTVRPVLYDDLTGDEARAAFESKFWGPFWAVYDGREHLRTGGSVVFYSGVAASRPVKGYIMGACINGAINAATRSLALELAPAIRVNAIAPGLTDTPLQDALHGHDKEERLAYFSSRLPVGRVGTADEMAMGAMYLMCDDFVTGQVITIDGGHECMS
jgi:NAD(P)-dependent dehydrogenase (short-subunit alcohol dehydrogenase family)